MELSRSHEKDATALSKRSLLPTYLFIDDDVHAFARASEVARKMEIIFIYIIYLDLNIIGTLTCVFFITLLVLHAAWLEITSCTSRSSLKKVDLHNILTARCLTGHFIIGRSITSIIDFTDTVFDNVAFSFDKYSCNR